MDANTAQIVRLESLDGGGESHELSESEKLNLARQIGEERIGELLEEAFEAGIECVLGNGARTRRSRESAEDSQLRHLLLAPLIAETSAKRLLQSDVLHRAILETLVHESIHKLGATGRSNPADGPSAEGGTPSRPS
jgi:hypothetical protein